MLEEIYRLLGYEDIFSIKSEKIRTYAVDKAHNHLMRVLLKCKDLGIVTEVNEDKIDEIESEE